MMGARKRPPAPGHVQTVHVPAPMGGLNSIQAAGMMGPEDCIQAYNVIASEYGLRSRLGSREWVTGLTGESDNYVRTVMSFLGALKSGANDKVFVTTSSGIWDATSSDATPALSHAFGINTGEAGYGVSHVVVTAAGHFLMYADEENGLLVWNGSAWAAVVEGVGGTEISGVDPSNFVFVTVFKGRVWAVEKNTANLWYSATGSLFGAYTKFALGQKLRSGGPLVGAWSWTYDGGAGIDDSLVVVSSGGDVLVYQGTDPASATSFSLRGVWSAGGLPAGRKIATVFGGDMLLLTRVGIIPLSRLVVGNPGEGAQYSTLKVGPLFNRLMLSRSTLLGWSLVLQPEDNALIVTVPEATGQATTQLVMSLANKGWFQYRDLPIYSAENHSGKLYFGTADGRVLINDGYVDGVSLADSSSWTAVQYAVLGSFQNLGNGQQKQVQTIRAAVLSETGAPSFEVAARYNYDFTELDPVVATSTTGGPVWDSAVWDESVWGGDYTPTQALRGAAGMGQSVAIAIRGAATSRTVIVGYDVTFRQGGPLG